MEITLLVILGTTATVGLSSHIEPHVGVKHGAVKIGNPIRATRLKAVDAHVHLVSTTNGIDYLWAKQPSNMTPPQTCPCKPPCYCNWTLADFVGYSNPVLDVQTVIFCEVDAAHTQWLEEVKWVQSLADQAPASGLPTIGAIIAQPPPGFLSVPVHTLGAELNELASIPLVAGVRPNFKAAGPRDIVTASLDELGKRGLVVDINMPLDNVSAIVRASPGTHFVIEHLGGANVTTVDDGILKKWVAQIKDLAALKNIECLQLGGVMHAFNGGPVDTDALARFTTAAVASFGWDRLCYEGNWFFNGAPLPTYAEWANALETVLIHAGATAENLQDVFHENSLRIYNPSQTGL